MFLVHKRAWLFHGPPFKSVDTRSSNVQEKFLHWTAFANSVMLN